MAKRSAASPSPAAPVVPGRSLPTIADRISTENRTQAPFTVSWPAGSPANGTLLIASSIVSYGETLNVPSGWSVLANETDQNGHGTGLFYRFATGGEPPSVTWSVRSGNSAAWIAVNMVAISNASPGAVPQWSKSTTATSALTTKAVTPAAPNALVLALFTGDADSAMSFSTASGWSAVSASAADYYAASVQSYVDLTGLPITASSTLTGANAVADGYEIVVGGGVNSGSPAPTSKPTSAPAPATASPTVAPTASSSGTVPLGVKTFEYADSWDGRNWSILAPYLTWTYLQNPSNYGAVSAAGIKTIWYQDPHRICVASGNCSDRPPSNALANSDYIQCNTTHSPMTSTYNSATGMYYGDPTSSHLASQTNAYTQQVIGAGHLDYVWFDDTMLIEDQFASTSCGQSNWTFANGTPYTDSAFASATATFNSSAVRPVLMEGVCNGDGATDALGTGKATDPAGITQIASGANVIGAMCETFTQGWHQPNGNGKLPYPDWQSHENTALQVQSYGKYFVAWPYLSEFGSGAAQWNDQRGYYYASFMLIYDPNLSIMKFNGWNAGAPSGVDLMPEGLLVPRNPLQTATWNGRIDALKKGNVYVREFAACYYRGAPIGQCAAVVNADESNSYALPPLSQTYSHSFTFGGYGILTGSNGLPNYGDTGTMSLTGPVSTSVGPTSWEILVR